MIAGLMMDEPLTITSILRHAVKFHPQARIISRLSDNSIHRYTYGEFGRRVHQLANALSTMGVKPGDRVATLAWNSYRHMEIYYAVSCMGAICHTLNPRLSAEQLIYIINHAEDTHLFFDLHFVERIEEISPRTKTIQRYIGLCNDDALPQSEFLKFLAYDNLVDQHSNEFSWPDLDERTASALCYTSGTTGNPKGVLYNHRTTLIHALSVSGGDWLAVRERDTILPVVPMFHANAWGIPYAALMNGADLVLPGHAMDGASIHELISAENVTLMAGVPTIWQELLRHLREADSDLASVERLMVGGSAAPRSLIYEFEETYDVRVIHGWGMTELSPVGTLGALKRNELSLPADQRYEIQAYQGRPLFGIDLRIVNDDGKILPHDSQAAGLLQVRGPWVANGYYGGDANEQFTSDGWFSTGDLASINNEGYLLITDRTKDVIKSGGEWISSIDLENIAMTHPDVNEAACIAVPHSRWGERPLLCVVPRQGAALDASVILANYDGKVPKWWVPDHVEFVEKLPYTATGKFSKLALRQQFSGYRLPTDC